MSENESHGLASTGSGKSEAEVAFELLNKLKGQGVWGERNISAILDMYAECLDATKGLRAYEGQKRVEVGIHKMADKQTATQAPANPQPAAVVPQAAAPAVAPQTQAQPQSIPRPQPVHAQQQVVAQAYKPAG